MIIVSLSNMLTDTKLKQIINDAITMLSERSDEEIMMRNDIEKFIKDLHDGSKVSVDKWRQPMTI